jgi:hypothetical protein
MGARQLALLAALMIFGCGSGAVASPPAVNLFSLSQFVRGEIQPVRWRYRYRRDYFWRGREGIERSDTNGFAAGSRLLPPEIARPVTRRRGGWVDPPPLQ